MQASINGIRLTYEVEGASAAPTVVLHHPLATNLSTWDELTAALSPALSRGALRCARARRERGFACALQLRDAERRRDRPDGPPEDRARTFPRAVHGRHGGPTSGARPAAAVLEPDPSSTSSRVPAEARPLWDERVKVTREKGMGSQVPLAMQRWLAAATRESKPALVARMSRYVETTPVEGYVGWCQAISTLDITDRLGGIELPTRVIVGAEDPSTPPAAAEVIHRGIAGSDLVVVPGVSHMLHVEEPATFNRHVLEFLDRQPKGRLSLAAGVSCHTGACHRDPLCRSLRRSRMVGYRGHRPSPVQASPGMTCVCRMDFTTPAGGPAEARAGSRRLRSFRRTRRRAAGAGRRHRGHRRRPARRMRRRPMRRASRRRACARSGVSASMRWMSPPPCSVSSGRRC